MAKHRMRQVFIPGGIPTLTYVPRDSLGLEDRLRKVKDHLCKLVTVTGATKSGKTVLTQHVFPKNAVVWIDGGSVSDETALWSQILDQVGGYTDVQVGQDNGTEYGIEGRVEGEAGFFLAKARASVKPTWRRDRSDTETRSRSLPAKPAAIRALRESKLPLVIDDFHYLDRGAQGEVVRGLKSLVADGHPVVLLAIPHRRYDAVRVEKEMTGRVETIDVPHWQVGDLLQIADRGFELLRVDVHPDVVQEFCEEALGSPHLMHEFCRQLCEDNGVEETQEARLTIEPKGLTDLFRHVAQGTFRSTFDRLKKGPRQRTVRIERKFKDGTSGDIYVAVLRAIAAVRPGMQTLDYEKDLRPALRELIDGELPQVHEVSRVLEHMARISAEDASTPVIDWEKDDHKLHVTDPFFAFYLKWGVGQQN